MVRSILRSGLLQMFGFIPGVIWISPFSNLLSHKLNIEQKSNIDAKPLFRDRIDIFAEMAVLLTKSCI